MYIELAEYVRLAVLNMHENLKASLAAERDESEALH